MTLVIKSDLVITNPKLGKLQVKQIITSCSLTRDTFGDIVGTSTDVFEGGLASQWSGSAVMEYVATGLSNSNNTTASTVYLNTPTFKNCEVSFEIVSLIAGGQIIFDLRRLTTDNKCIRFSFSGTKQTYITNRYSGGNPFIQSSYSIAEGDKINIRLQDNSVQVYVNNILKSNVTITAEAQDELNREGLLALSKGSTETGQVIIKNLMLAKLS